MSGTTSTISILKNNNMIKTIFVNYDGEPSRSGKILNEYYCNTELVNNLIKKGNISGLNVDENFSDKKPAILFKTKEEYLEKVKYYNFNYLFKEKEQIWYIVKGNKLNSLSELLDKKTKERVN